MLHDKPKRMTKPSPFILKLSQILAQPLNQHLISWSPCNTAFVVHQPYQFSSSILPKYFRHNNYGSFLRQLNFYCFTKNKSAHDELHQFKHPLFRRGEEENYGLIKRERTRIQKQGRDDEDSLEGESSKVIPKVLKQPLSQKILDLQRSQQKLMQECKDIIQQGIQTLQWGLIRSAEVGDDTNHNKIICRRLSDLIQSYPQLAEHLTYFDTDMINKLMDFLDADPISTFPTTYQTAMNKFFRMLENTQGWMVVEMIENFMSVEKKKSKTFTIVNKKERKQEAVLQLKDGKE